MGHPQNVKESKYSKRVVVVVNLWVAQNGRSNCDLPLLVHGSTKT